MAADLEILVWSILQVRLASRAKGSTGHRLSDHVIHVTSVNFGPLAAVVLEMTFNALTL